MAAVWPMTNGQTQATQWLQAGYYRNGEWVFAAFSPAEMPEFRSYFVHFCTLFCLP